MVGLEYYQLIPQACFALAECVHPAPDRCDALADVEVEPLHKGRLDRPAISCQDLCNGRSCTSRLRQIPPDFVVKSQLTDIIDIIVHPIKPPNSVHMA
jgi:hypothetical protein